MNVPRALGMSVLAATIALTMSALPAQATHLSPADLADASSVMLTESQAKALGVKKHYVAEFDVDYTNKGAAKSLFLCDSAGIDIEGPGAGSVFDYSFADGGGNSIFGVEQDIHWYANEQSAKKAYNAIVKQVKRCVGQQEEAGAAITTKLTNGEKKAKDGDAFLWVNSETILGDPTTNFADHNYTTVRLFGNFIQKIYMESEGLDATPLTKKQIAAADRLTDSLGDAWQAKFM